MKNVKYSSMTWQEGKYFVAQCLSLNVEVSSFGSDKEEALTNLEEALSLYFEDAKDDKFSPIINAEIINST